VLKHLTFKIKTQRIYVNCIAPTQRMSLPEPHSVCS